MGEALMGSSQGRHDFININENLTLSISHVCESEPPSNERFSMMQDDLERLTLNEI